MSIESIVAELLSEEYFNLRNGGSAAAGDNDNDDDDDDDDDTDDWDIDSPFPFPTSGDKTSERTSEYARLDHDQFVFEANAPVALGQSLEVSWKDLRSRDDENPDAPEPDPVHYELEAMCILECAEF